MGFKFNIFTQKLDIAAETIWGQITGTLSDQLDLQTELDGKSNIVHTHIAADITDFNTAISNNTDVSANTSARHSHANKALLDTYTQSEINLADAVSKKHSQNTDIVLDQGQANEVTAVDLRIHLDDIITNPHDVTATLTATDTTNFDGVLSAAEDTVQKSLDILDDAVANLKIKYVNFPAPDANAEFGDFKVLALGANANASMTFSIPEDFVSLISLDVIYIPLSSIVSEDIDLNSDYGAIGEVSNMHSESSLGIIINASANTITAQDISAVFSSLSAGDFAGINWKNNAVGTTVNIIMIKIKYLSN